MAEKVTLAEAKALGFNSTKGITKEGGMYKFDVSLAPERQGFQSVGVAKPGEVQMTPYYGDVTGSYRLTQQQYAAAGATGGVMNTAALARAMQENEIAVLMKDGLTREQALGKIASQYGQYAIGGGSTGLGGTPTAGGYDSQGVPTPGGSYNAQGQFVGASLTGTPAATAATAAATAAATKAAQGQSAFDLLRQQFAQYGLEALTEDVEKYIKDGLSPAEFTLRLRTESEAYKKRFAANPLRVAKGLRALSEAEYIAAEDQFQNVMRQYGLPESYYSRGDMGRQQGFEKLIANDVSVAELEDRIATAQNRIINNAPEVAKTLRSFYPSISDGDILAYALDPEQALINIKRKVTAAEIGAGAAMAGLNKITPDMTPEQIAAIRGRAEELARYGVTGESARQGFRTVAEVAPRGGQLAEFYGQTPYTQATAEQEVFGLGGAVEAERQRKKLTQLEQATFAGRSGAADGALARDRAGAF